MKKINSTPFSMRIDTADRNKFQELYPYCLSRFIKICIKKAVKDKKFFQNIYFSEV